jgi:uncharacterized protein (DUF697 family)
MEITETIRREITEIENRTDMSAEDKASQITHCACIACAAIAVQPIPFADIFVLTPIQAYFASRIAAIRGVPVSESGALDIIKEIIGIVGLGIMAQQIALGIWKFVTFGLGGFLTIPMVYGLTYAIMKVSDAYFLAKAKGITLSDKEIQEMWKTAKREGEKEGDKHSKKDNAR